jgi:hypothetical protein
VPNYLFQQVRFRYTLNDPTLAGSISTKKERQEFGSDWPFGPLGVLTKEDQTAPYQTTPQKLQLGLKLFSLSLP